MSDTNFEFGDDCALTLRPSSKPGFETLSIYDGDVCVKLRLTPEARSALALTVEEISTSPKQSAIPESAVALLRKLKRWGNGFDQTWNREVFLEAADRIEALSPESAAQLSVDEANRLYGEQHPQSKVQSASPESADADLLNRLHGRGHDAYGYMLMREAAARIEALSARVALLEDKPRYTHQKALEAITQRVREAGISDVIRAFILSGAPTPASSDTLEKQ